MTILHSLDRIESAIAGLSAALATNSSSVGALCGEHYEANPIQPVDSGDVVARLSHIALRLRELEKHADHDTELVINALASQPKERQRMPRASTLDAGSQVPSVIGESTHGSVPLSDEDALAAALSGADFASSRG